MKKIMKILSIVVFLLSFGSCNTNDKTYQEVESVPVYAITNTSAAHAITIYREKPLLIEFTDEIKAFSFDINSYSDSSDETNYNVTFIKVIITQPESGPATSEEVAYEITGDVITGIGSLKTTVDNGDGSFTEEIYTIEIAKENRLN
jgi:hypothetical protein